MKQWSVALGMAILGLILASSSAQAVLIASGTVPYNYSNGTGNGTIDWWGYTSPGNPLDDAYPEDFKGATSEWTYQVNQSTGEYDFLFLHLGSLASSVMYLENPDSASGAYFNASSCTALTPCTTADWSVYIDGSGTIKWNTVSGNSIAAPSTTDFFEYYSSLGGSSSCTASIGDGGETDTSAGCPGITTVPEPTTLLILGSGLVGWGLWGRKRLKA